MTEAEKTTIHTFCSQLSLALCQITGETIAIQPDMLSAPVETEPQPEQAQRQR